MVKLTEQEVRNKLKQFIGTNAPTILAKVKDVDKKECTCTIDDDGTEYYNVRLRSITGQNNGIVLFPKVDSFLLAVKVEDSEDWAMLSASEYESIEINIESLIVNGGELGGLIKINELTTKLNTLVDIFNSHTHQVATTGTAAAQSGTATPTTGKVQKFNASDYEDKKINH